MDSRAVRLPRPVARDVWLLGLHGLDVLVDTVVGGNWFLFLRETLGATLAEASILLGFLSCATALLSALIAARVQDSWPDRGPLPAVVLTRLGAAVVTLALALVGATAPRSSVTLAACAVLGTVGYATTRAFSSLSFFLAFTRTGKTQRRRRMLFTLDYGVGNAAMVLGRGATALVRFALQPLYGMADTWLVASGVLGYVLVAALAHWVHRRYLAERSDVWAPARSIPIQGEDAAPAFVWRDFRRLVLFVAALQGVRAAFVHLDMTLREDLIRRFHEATWFPIFLSVNPLLIAIFVALCLCPLRTKDRHQWILDPFKAMMLGTAIQTTAFLWLAFAEAEWAVVVAVVHFTVGEAVGMPREPEIVATLVPDGTFGLYQGILSVPLALVQLGVMASSAALLETTRPRTMWLIVMGTTALTPLALAAYWYWRRRWTRTS